MAQPRILIVEDDEIQRDLLRSILELEDYSVLEAEEGYQALEVARRESPQLIITDNFMPGLDGYSLIQALREDPELDSIPVVLLSAGDEDLLALRSRLRPGIDVFMQKPIQADDLVRVIVTTLTGRG